jgi:hypothetical protein
MTGEKEMSIFEKMCRAVSESGRQARSLGLVALLLAVSLILLSCTAGDGGQQDQGEVEFPVMPVVLVEGQFSRCEGIAFNGEGDLYVAGDSALWRVNLQGEVNWICAAHSNLGLAPVGARDILFADFGPTNAWDHGPNRDGVVWRVTPEGIKSVAAAGMGDPNFVLVLGNGEFLVSDDATDEIFVSRGDGSVEIFTRQINHPNGMALSPDGGSLYVAQMFRSINPNITDGRLWILTLENNRIQGVPRIAADLGDAAANDGLAVDVQGRIYVAAWGTGQIWRFDPQTNETLLIAEGMPGVASLAFGRGNFNHRSIYATSTLSGTVWEVGVGIEGASLIH